MKRLFRLRFITACMLLVSIPMIASSKKSKEEGGSYNAKQVLVVGLHDNVKSNYFYNGLIAEETGIKADSIVPTYNRIIAENIAEASKENGYRFIPAGETQVSGQVLNEIKVNGESEESYADLSAVSTDEFRKVLDNADADYMLVLNQHYLKWQEQPLRTLFHIVSYTVFDKNKKEVCRGNNYFTCMNLENADKMRKVSRKSSSKIASSISKTLAEE